MHRKRRWGDGGMGVWELGDWGMGDAEVMKRLDSNCIQWNL